MTGIPVRTPADIGALIRDRRKARGLDQAELAANVGVSRLWINQVEGGKPGANLGLILRTLAALDITLLVATGGPSPSPVTSSDIDAVIAAARRKTKS